MGLMIAVYDRDNAAWQARGLSNNGTASGVSE